MPATQHASQQKTADDLKALSAKVNSNDIARREQLKAIGDDIDQLREITRQNARSSALARAQAEQANGAREAVATAPDSTAAAAAANAAPVTPGSATLLVQGAQPHHPGKLLDGPPELPGSAESVPGQPRRSRRRCSDRRVVRRVRRGREPGQGRLGIQARHGKYPKSDFAATSLYKRAEAPMSRRNTNELADAPADRLRVSQEHRLPARNRQTRPSRSSAASSRLVVHLSVMPIPKSSNGEMPFLDHLEELRWRIIYAGIALVIGVAIGLSWRSSTISVASVRCCHTLMAQKLVSPSVDVFSIHIQIAFVIGFGISAPVIGYQIWAFMSPALHSNEKQVVIPVLMAGAVLFLIGVGMAWFIVLPMSLKWFYGLVGTSLQPMYMASEYIGFVTDLALAFGVAFELPLLLVA